MAGGEGGPISPGPTAHAAVGGAPSQLPRFPPCSSKWGKLRGPLIPPGWGGGLLTSVLTPPLKKKKKPVFPSHDRHFLSHCGSRDVCCWLPWRRPPWALPWLCGERTAPPSRPTVGVGWGGLPRGLFQAECVWSPMPQIPQGPPDFCLWEGVAATQSD